jgi:hypothetical protein
MLQTLLITDRDKLTELVHEYKIKITTTEIYQQQIPCIGIIYSDSDNKNCFKAINNELIARYNGLYDDCWK